MNNASTYLHRFKPVEQGSDFFDNLQHCRDDGEKRRLFMDEAGRSDVPLRAIGEMLTYRDQLLVTLALQSLTGIKNSDIRSKLVNLELIEGVDPSPEEIYTLPDPDEYQPWSVLVFHKLCEQAQSGNDLERVSAAWTIDQLGYSQALTGKLLDQPAPKIWDKILHDKANDRHFSSDRIKYQDYVEFWTFVPVPALMWFLRSAQHNTYQVIDSILERLGVLGVELALGGIKSLNIKVLQSALTFAESIAVDEKYSDDKTQQSLVNMLLPVLEDSRLDLVYIVVNILEKKSQYLSDSEWKIIEFILFKTPHPPSKFTNFTQEEFTARVLLYREPRDSYQSMFETAILDSKKSEKVKNIEPVLQEIARLRHQEIVIFILFSTPPLLADQAEFTVQDFENVILDYQYLWNDYKQLYEEAIRYYESYSIFGNIVKIIEELMVLLINEFQRIHTELIQNLNLLKEAQESIQKNMNCIGNFHSEYLQTLFKEKQNYEWENYKSKLRETSLKYQRLTIVINNYNECTLIGKILQYEIMSPLHDYFKNSNAYFSKNVFIEKELDKLSPISIVGSIFVLYGAVVMGVANFYFLMGGILILTLHFGYVRFIRNKNKRLVAFSNHLSDAFEYLKSHTKHISLGTITLQGERLTERSFRFVERIHERFKQS